MLCYKRRGTLQSATTELRRTRQTGEEGLRRIDYLYWAESRRAFDNSHIQVCCNERTAREDQRVR